MKSAFIYLSVAMLAIIALQVMVIISMDDQYNDLEAQMSAGKLVVDYIEDDGTVATMDVKQVHVMNCLEIVVITDSKDNIHILPSDEVVIHTVGAH